jgi:hypothetical protein
MRPSAGALPPPLLARLGVCGERELKSWRPEEGRAMAKPSEPLLARLGGCGKRELKSWRPEDGRAMAKPSDGCDGE